MVKIGTVATQKRLFYNLHKIKSRLGLYGDASLSDETAEQIATQLGVTKRDVVEMEQRLSGDSSLNATLSHDSATNYQDMLTADEETIEEKLGESQEMLLKKKLLKEALATLSDRERLIVQKRFLTDNPETLENLGLEFHISRERVRQIETKAYQKVSKAIHASAAKYAL